VHVRQCGLGADQSFDGWVRTRNLNRQQRAAGRKPMPLGEASRHKSSVHLLADPAPSAAEGAAEAAPAEAGAAEAGAAEASASEAGAAGAVQSPEELAAEISSWLRMTLDEAKLKPSELFADWARGQKGRLTLPVFLERVPSLGIKSAFRARTLARRPFVRRMHAAYVFGVLACESTCVRACAPHECGDAVSRRHVVTPFGDAVS
jgi:hypothetical protein